MILKHLWGVIWPYNLIYIAMAFVCWLWLTPSLETTASFAIGWIAFLYLRNVVLLVLVAGALHLRLYIKRAQGTRFKYSDKWLAANDRKFTFGNQTRDNVFWSLVSGCIVWTAYEAVTLWAFSNQIIPYLDMRQYPIYAVLLTLAVIYFRYFHFYFVHRLIHWKPLYKLCHALHHRNINVGPWSGLSMHPIEHIVYFSCVFFNWIVPSSPFHAIFNLLHAGISPAVGHAGFHRWSSTATPPLLQIAISIICIIVSSPSISAWRSSRWTGGSRPSTMGRRKVWRASGAEPPHSC